MMKNLTKPNPECDYSFEQLYLAAYGEILKPEEKLDFQNLSQEEINKLVKKWAQKAGWTTMDKQGNDKKIYTSFRPIGKQSRI